jgi:hypothetical protein
MKWHRAPYGPVVKSGAGEIAFVDFFPAIVLQVGISLAKNWNFSFLPGRQSRTIVEHVMVGIYAYYYQATLMAQEFPEPIGDDIVMGIYDDDLYSTDEQLDGGKPAGTSGH